MAPATLSGLSFLGGVFAAGTGWGFYFTFLLTTLLTIRLLLARPRRALLVIPGVILGFFYYHLFLNWVETTTQLKPSADGTFQGVVVSEAKKYERVQLLELRLLPPGQGKIEALLPLTLHVNYGDVLKIKGSIEPPAQKADKPKVFSPTVEKIASRRGFWLKQKLLELKEKFILKYQRFLPAEAAALISGLTFGGRADFSPELKEAMIRSGTTHLVALSGYNISVVVHAVAAAFGFWLNRRLTFFLTSIFILLFVLMTGGEASIVRAAIMGFLLLAARESGRVSKLDNVLILTAAGMTLFNPTLPVYDIGFQLSFLSLIGIVYLAPALVRIWGWEKADAGFLGWRENLTLTVSAQAAVLPILIHHFREFSLTAVAANTLILGTVPAAMFLGFILAALGFVSEYLGIVVGWLTNIILSYQLAVIKTFSQIRLFFAGEAGMIFIFLYYALMIGFILWERERFTLPLPAVNNGKNESQIKI